MALVFNFYKYIQVTCRKHAGRTMKGVFTSQPNYLPEGNAGAWWPSPCAQPPRTNSKRGLAWLARPPWTFHWSRSVSTLVVKSHSTPGLLVILIYPLKRKENINSGSRVKKDFWKYYKRNQMEHRISIAKMRTKKSWLHNAKTKNAPRLTLFLFTFILIAFPTCGDFSSISIKKYA